jgi:LuxR family transcriptional regulator, maltose regulon positive regulatory protein
MPRLARYVVRWEATDASYYASDENLPLINATWGTWIKQHSSFSFKGQYGHINLLKERRQASDDGYWYAYRRQGKHVHKRYVGRSDQLTLARLEELTRNLYESSSLSESDMTKSRSIPQPRRVPTTAPLLTAKLQPPRLRTGLIPRERLLRLLDAGSECTLMIISAPAGYGKTTLVNQWITSRTKMGNVSDFVWLSLDAGDADPARFWRYFITACQHFHPSVGQDALALLHTATLPPFELPSQEALLTIVLNDLIHYQCKGVLILEDYHLIMTPQIQDAMVFFVEHLPVELHLILMTRSDPLFPLTRWRAQGLVAEIVIPDLCFTREETSLFLQTALALIPNDEELEHIEARLEGWAAGLRMLAIALQGQTTPKKIHTWLSGTQGNQWAFGDYFVAEILEKQPEDIQRFLLLTSQLLRISGDLCDAVLERTDSAELLEIIEKAGLFLEPPQQDGGWYRYHTLFAEAMQREALRRLGDSEIHHAARQASAWYAAHEMLPEAIESGFQAGEFTSVAQLIEAYVGPNLFILGMTTFSTMQEFHTLHHWLKSLPETLLLHNPTLCMIYAATELMMFITQQPIYESLMHIERVLRDAEDGWRQQGNTAHLGEVFAFRALIARERGAIREAVTWADQALIWLPDESTAWRSVVISVRGVGAWFTDQLARSQKLLIEAQSLNESLGNRAFVRANTNMLAYVMLEMGQLHRAEQQFRTVLVEARADDDHDDIGRINGALAELSYEWNDLDAAWEANTESLAMSRSLKDEETLSYGTLMRARILHARGEISQALDELATIEERLIPPIIPLRARLLREIQTQIATIHLHQGKLEVVQGWWEAQNPQHENISRIQLAREEALYAQLLFAQGRLEDTKLRLSAICDEAQYTGFRTFLLQIQVVLASVYMADKDLTKAQQIMRTVLTTAQPEGYIRLFLDNGPMSESLIRSLIPGLHEPTLHTYAQKLLRAFAHERGDANSFHITTDALSSQERRVLRLLVAGRSNPEIAQELVVSINTIKAHIKNIYRKLSVSSRVEATLIARQQHLI